MLDYRPLLLDALRLLAKLRDFEPANFERTANPRVIVKSVEHRILVLSTVMYDESMIDSAVFAPVLKLYRRVHWLWEHSDSKHNDRWWGQEAIRWSLFWKRLRREARAAIKAVSVLPPPDPQPPETLDLPVEHLPQHPADPYPDDEEGCEEAGQRWWDLREILLYLCAAHGTTSPDDYLAFSNADFYLNDSPAPLRYQLLEVYNFRCVTREFVLDLADGCASFPPCGVTLAQLKKGLAVVEAKRLILVGDGFAHCRSLDDFVATIQGMGAEQADLGRTANRG